MPDLKFRWVGGPVARRFGEEHHLAIGASGSGKSTIINHIINSVIPDPNVRAIIYDPKQELVPFLYGIRGFYPDGNSIASSVKILHPFDMRSVSWDMAADIDDPISARQLATILVPDGSEKSENSFFSNAVRDLLTAIILAFVECVPNPKSWTFRDVLLAMLHEEYMDFICKQTTMRNGSSFTFLQRVRDCYLGDKSEPKTRANIYATISSKLSIYEPVAAAWDHAKLPLGGTFSLREWLREEPGNQGGQILVLGNDESARAAIDPINQALFKRAVELTLSRPERSPQERQSGANQLWFFLDEIREAGRLDGLGRLLTKGRSKGACVVMGFQDIDGLREVYGKEMANEICAQFNNIAVMRVNSPETAQWASDLFGRRLDFSHSSSQGFSTGPGSSINISNDTSEQERPFLYSETFLFGTNASASKSVNGYRKGPDQQTEEHSRDEVINMLKFTEPYEAKRKSRDLIEEEFSRISGYNLTNTRMLTSEFYARPSHQQYLRLWDQKDWVRLGFPGSVPTGQSSLGNSGSNGASDSTKPRSPRPTYPASSIAPKK